MHRRRPREKAVYGRVTGCCRGIGKRHSDQHGKEPAGRPCCAPHGFVQNGVQVGGVKSCKKNGESRVKYVTKCGFFS